MKNVKTRDFGGKLSPSQVLIDVMQYTDEAKTLVVVFIDKDDCINTAWADGALSQRVGLCDIAKHRMIDLAWRDEEAK
jgi:hypothetical protein